MKRKKYGNIKKNCPNCNSIFLTNDKRRKYCSVSCCHSDIDFRELHRNIKLKNPVNYWLGKKRLDMNKVKGWNRTGEIAWNKGKKCPQLSGEKHGNWTGKHSKIHICELCDSKFETKRYNQQRFCSKKCKSDWMSKEGIVRGENNFMWNGGSSLNGHTWEFKMKISPMLREKYPCFVCGTKKDLLVHHVDLDKQNNILTNLAVMCRPHHSEIHSIIQRLSNGR